MSNEQAKSKAFVARLLSNPALNGYTPLQKEEQIIQFLHANASQLAPTLSSAAFFPGKNWNQIFTLLISGLYETIDEAFLADLNRMIEGQIGFTFIPFLRQQNVAYDKVKEQIRKFLTTILKKNEARRSFTGAYSSIVFRKVDAYLSEVFRRKSYIHFELTKVQRLKMSKDEIKNMIDATLLIKPSIHLLASDSAQNPQERLAGVVQNQFAEKVFQILKKQLVMLPEQLLYSVVHSNVSFLENRYIEATARMAAIFAARCKNYRPGMKVDRGADTPDKSWFNIARKNYKFYGFDVKMLDELYKVAAENGW